MKQLIIITLTFCVGFVFGFYISKIKPKKQEVVFDEAEYLKIIEECTPDYEKMLKEWIRLRNADNKLTEIKSIKPNWGTISVDEGVWHEFIEKTKKQHEK